MKRLNLKGGPASAADMQEAANTSAHDAPPSGGASSGGSGGGARRYKDDVPATVHDFLKGKIYAAADRKYRNPQLHEERNMLGAVSNMIDGGGLAAIEGAKGPYYAMLGKSGDYAQALADAAKHSGVAAEDIVAQFGGDAALEQAMRATQTAAYSHTAGINRAVNRASALLGEGLISGDDAVRLAAADALGVEQDALAKAWGLNPGNEPGGADAQLPDWLPRMDNLSPVQTSAAYGLAAAGAGAAGIALANHLLAKGQQQSDPIAYAQAMQAMQAMNAY